MTTPQPMVTVITPVYNRAPLIGDAIATVRAQTLTDWEMLIIDDCSGDDIAGAVAAAAQGDARIRLIRRETNGGPGGARNTGLDAATGRCVAFLDSDDRWDNGKLAAQMAAIAASDAPDDAFCVTRTRVLYADGRADRVLPTRAAAPGERFASYLYVANEFAQCSSFLLGPRLARRVRFEPSLRQYEDHLFFIAAGAAGARHLLVEAAMVDWRNDARPDRMGARDDEARGRAFLAVAQAQGLMNPLEQLCFELRCLGPDRAARSRREGLSLALRALRFPGAPREAALKQALRALTGEALYARLRIFMG